MFEVYSKVYVMSAGEKAVYFTNNDIVADFGGAKFVNDSTNTATCASNHNISVTEASES